MATTSLVQTLLRFHLFKGFAPEEVWEILVSGKVRELKPGEVLLEPGKANDTLFLLINGELKVVLEKEGVDVSIPIPPGECIGEMSVVVGRPTSALVMANKKSRVLVISEDTFWNHLALTRNGVRNLLGMMAQRLQKNNDALMERVEEELKYKLLEKEVETAGKIQANIVPDGRYLLPDFPQVEAYALISQARDVGGDFYDVLPLDDDHIYIAIGDVSGKGMPAALFMMRVFTSLRLLVTDNPGFENVIPAVNKVVARNNEDMMFVSLFAGVLNVRTGVFRYVNAGHNPPFAAHDGESFQLLDLPTETFIGIQPQGAFPVAELSLKPGDTLLLYTDGITEATNAEGEMFEVDRTREALDTVRTESLEVLVKSLETTIDSFVDTAPQHDDYTLLGVRYLGA
jgi:sigma-B regulation protein RsbU (phosphoserine phosphatase)